VSGNEWCIVGTTGTVSNKQGQKSEWIQGIFTPEMTIFASVFLRQYRYDTVLEKYSKGTSSSARIVPERRNKTFLKTTPSP
jgi:hypothetical protein